MGAVIRRLVVAAMAATLVAACGESGERTGASTAANTSAAGGRTVPAGAARHGPIPRALRTAESAAEDTIDLALAGKRAKVVAKANALKAVADGPAEAALRAAGVSDGQIAEFRARADEVAKLAPKADLLRVAMASNRAFGLMPEFFALYDSPVPAAVTALDYLDFEAKLQAEAGAAAALRSAVTRLDRSVAALRSAVTRLDRTWLKLRPDVVRSGGARVAARFDAHVQRMERLAAAGNRAAGKEAQHGLDLVDELEAVYDR
jgi:hypothetical protein